MKNLIILIFLGLAVSSCSKDSIGVETSQGKVSLMSSDGELIPLQGMEVFIRTSQCKSDNWFSSGTYEFIEDLDERAFTDDQGNYSLRFEVVSGRSFGPKIVIPDNYRVIQSGGRSPATLGETFYYDFLLEFID